MLVSEPQSTSITTRVELDGLFGHLSSSTGLYSKETFLSLFSAITRMIRDQRMHGLVLTRTLGDEAFEAMACALENQPDLALYRFDGPDIVTSPGGIPASMGFLSVLSDRFCAHLHWSSHTDETFNMFEGGWTFHPGDTRTMATHFVEHLDNPDLLQRLHDTQTDRRYDDKLNAFIASLVHGLEARNRQLLVAYDQLKSLNHKMVQSEKLAAIGQLSSVIAHEIRNPLGLIDLYAKLVEGQLEQITVPDADTEKQAQIMKNLSQIRQATQSLETILSELTDYARPVQLHRMPMDLVALVRETCEFYAPKYAEKEIQFEYPGLDMPPVVIEMDADRIRQSLINLIKNALEVSPQNGTVSVSVSNRQGARSAKDRLVYVKVADEGPGVPADVAKKLFTPYFSTKKQGTGLGLAHSRKILQAHGGNVELLGVGRSGVGATFALTLPTGANGEDSSAL